MATTGYGCSRIPVLYGLQPGRCAFFPDGIPSQRCGRCKTPATSTRLRPETRTTSSVLDGRRGLHVLPQNITEHNPAPSPSGHPLLSGPPTGNDIHQMFTTGGCAPAPSLHANTRNTRCGNSPSVRAFRYTRPRTTQRRRTRTTYDSPHIGTRRHERSTAASAAPD